MTLTSWNYSAYFYSIFPDTLGKHLQHRKFSGSSSIWCNNTEDMTVCPILNEWTICTNTNKGTKTLVHSFSSFLKNTTSSHLKISASFDRCLFHHTRLLICHYSTSCLMWCLMSEKNDLQTRSGRDSQPNDFFIQIHFRAWYWFLISYHR